MNISLEQVHALANKYGDDFFVFNKCKFVDNFTKLELAFKKRYSNFKIGYSYKTNYTPYLCNLVNDLGGLAEVVSDMELELAELIGVLPENIIYNGPSKSEASLRRALLKGSIVNLDSFRDLNILVSLAGENPDRSFGCVLRCNFEVDSVGFSRFGFDVQGDDFRNAMTVLESKSNIRVDGLHCHFPNRDLESYRRRIETMLELIDCYFPHPPKFLNIGGGFFSSMPKDMWESFGGCPPTFDDYADVIAGAVANHFPSNDGPTLLIEPGTALVADTFSFICKVISVKSVRNKNIATVQGSIFTISPTARNQSLPVSIISDKPYSTCPFDIAGFTCIEGDYLSKAVPFNISEGDFIRYDNVGSYSVVMKPPFILPAPPVLSTDGEEFMVIKERESNANIFERFVL